MVSPDPLRRRLARPDRRQFPPGELCPARMAGRDLRRPMWRARSLKSGLPCPLCGDSIAYKEILAGQVITCGYCKRPLKMPFVAQLPREYQEELRHKQDKAQKKAKRPKRRNSGRNRRSRKESERSLSSFRQRVVGPGRGRCSVQTGDAQSAHCPRCGSTQLSCLMCGHQWSR